MAQIIDENAEINEGLDQYLGRIGVTKSGTDYHILSIIGAQSSGKSTLLNHMFGTEFATMNETTGRQQTTKGIHCAYNNNKTLVFDIEGSDSRERGDSDALFERKAALFALALSEVVIVNMWQNDIGRYQASSIPLLRTVFEVNLQLFASSAEAKCHLLFIIRDATLNTEVLEKQVRRDLDLIWAGLTLPPNFQGRPFDDFFIFHFEALPHMRLKPEDFKVAVKRLSDRFLEASSENYMFKQQSQKIIPGDGLCEYIHNVWEAITENKELNLPSQRRQLSNYKCDTFVNQIIEEFTTSSAESLGNPLSERAPIGNFKDIAEKMVQEGLNKYDFNSSKYVKEIVEEKRAELLNKMNMTLFTYYEQQCRYSLAKAEEDFHQYINKELPSDLAKSDGWEQKAGKKLDECIQFIHTSINNSSVSYFKWDYDSSTTEEHLQSFMLTKLDELKTNLETVIIQEELEKYKPIINKIIDEAQPNMWEQLRKQMNEVINTTHTRIDVILAKNASKLKSTPRLNEKFHRTTVNMVLNASRFTSQKMINRFEEKFNRDENGKTRTWKPDGPDINIIFEEARDAGLLVLKMFKACQLREPNELVPPHDILTQTLIGSLIIQKYEDKFTEVTNKEYTQAVQIRESMRVKFNIPWWMIGLMGFFGYDKIIKAFYHPFLAILVVSLVVLFYYLYKKGYLDSIIFLSKKYISQGIVFMVTKISGKPVPTKSAKSARMTRSTSRDTNDVSRPTSNSIIEEEMMEDLSKTQLPATSRRKKPIARRQTSHKVGMTMRPSDFQNLSDSLHPPQQKTMPKRKKSKKRASVEDN